MLFPHKKASLAFFVAIVALLLGFGVAIYAGTNLVNKGDKLTEGKSCQLSLVAENAGEDSWLIPEIENVCTTIELELPEAKKRDVKTSATISRDFAKYMMRAWDITGKGKVKDLWDNQQGRSLLGGDCFVMYAINLDYQPFDEYTQLDLYQWMLFEEYDKIDGRSISYVDYIQEVGGIHGKGELSFPEIVKPTGNWEAFVDTLNNIVDEEEQRKESYSLEYENQPLQQGQQYAISVISPRHTSWTRLVASAIWINRNLGFTNKDNTLALTSSWKGYETIDIGEAEDQALELEELNNILMFSTLDYAKQQGCVTR